MSMVSERYATCPKCGDKEQRYIFYASWFSAFGNRPPQIKNACTKCGAELSEEDAGEPVYKAARRNVDFIFKGDE